MNPQRSLARLRQKPVEIMSEADFKLLCQRVQEILMDESNVPHVSSPVIICGDLHGQFRDALTLFEVGGELPKERYIFLGDYVDRGHDSVETLQMLLLLKLLYPSRVTLLRGNHESRQITKVYGFYDECVRKYGNANPWKYCTDLFDFLNVAALVDGTVLCVHGGLSPCVKLVDQLRLIPRVEEIPHSGPFGDVVWSDPDEVDGWAVNPRGAGWLFGRRIAKEFNHINDLELVVRAHQLAMEGFNYVFPPDHPLVTIWSAPNYCYRCGNVAAIMRLNENLRHEFVVFKQAAEGTVSEFS